MSCDIIRIFYYKKLCDSFIGYMNFLLKCPFLLLGLLLVFAEGCISSPNHQLEEVKNIIDEMPDSALEILAAIDNTSYNNDQDRALHALLLTQARYKNYVEETDDSVICAAAGCFLRNDMKDEAGLALFLTGMIQMNSNRLGDAAVSFTRGLDISRQANTYKNQGLCAKGLFLLYAELYDGANQIKYAKESYDAFLRGGYTDWADYARLDVATAYNNQCKYDKAISEAIALAQDAKMKPDTVLLAEALRLSAVSLFAIGDNIETISYYGEVYEIMPEILTVHDKENIVMASTEIVIDSLSVGLQNMIDIFNTEDDRFTPFELLARNGDYERAYKSIEQYKIEQDEILTSLLRNNVSDALDNYNHSQELLHQERIKNERLFWFVIVLIGLVISLTIVYVLQRSLSEAKHRRDAVIRDVEYLRTDLLRQMERNNIMSVTIRELFNQKYSIVNTLCEAYYESKGLKLEQKRIVKEVEQLIQDFKDNSNRHKLLIEYVDKYTNNAYSDFIADFSGLRTEEFRLFLFFMLGFSARSIALLFDEKIENLYNWKSRLKTKIRRSDSIRKDEYLSYIL